MSRRKIKNAKICPCCGLATNIEKMEFLPGSRVNNESVLVCKKCLSLSEDEHKRLFEEEQNE